MLAACAPGLPTLFLDPQSIDIAPIRARAAALVDVPFWHYCPARESVVHRRRAMDHQLAPNVVLDL